MSFQRQALLVLLPAILLAQPKITAPQYIRWDRHCFTIENRDVILFGGSMHYFRVPEAEWEPTLRRVKADGFNLIDTYVPWAVHEPEEGKVDFSSLEHFLNLAARNGLYVVARPGPYICSEFDQGGFPRWLSGRDIGFRTNSDANRRWTKHWYDAVMPVLARNQVSHGGPVVMVQIENEYGHPQYLPASDKQEYLRFLFTSASSHRFDTPVMGNDIQFAQKVPDRILSQIYGTVDAYFDTYQNLGKMLQDQRDFNPKAPVGSAEYSLAEPEATVCTMLSLGTAYFDLYMFRGGSQFTHAAKGYEVSSYVVGAPLEEGGYASGKYYALKTAAHFLETFGAMLARGDPAPVEPSGNDPEVWIRQRNQNGRGFLFLRSDSSGVNARTLRLETVDNLQIRYRDPRSSKPRSIPRYTTLILRPHESRILPLNLPVSQGTELLYSTANLFGIYPYPKRTWLVFYGDPGTPGELALSFQTRPGSLHQDAFWNDENREAAYRFQFAERDQVVSLTDSLSILLLSRNRGYRAHEFKIKAQPVLVVSDADEVEAETSGSSATLHLHLRRKLGEVTVLPDRSDDAMRLQPQTGGSNWTLPRVGAQIEGSWPASGFGSLRADRQLRSLPDMGIWRKGITRYRANLPALARPVRLQFFTDDYHTVYVNGEFAPEASNRAREVVLGSRYFAAHDTAVLEIYYADTGRPKEDLGSWRMDERKGLASAAWISIQQIIPINVEWRIDFASLEDLASGSEGDSKLTATTFSFSTPDDGDLDVVWRAHFPNVRGLIYINGIFFEHHEPSQPAPNSGERTGTYLPPSILHEKGNRLLFISLEPAEPLRSDPPRILADSDSIRRKADLVIDFSTSTVALGSAHRAPRPARVAEPVRHTSRANPASAF